MRNSGASVDDAVENYLDKRSGGVVSGEIESTSIKTTEAKADILAVKDGTLSVDVSDLCDANIINLANNTIPTADPGIPGRLWSDSGTLKVSL